MQMRVATPQSTTRSNTAAASLGDGPRGPLGPTDAIVAAPSMEVPMSNTFTQTHPITLSTISPDLAVVCLFSLLGLTLSVAVLSYVSSETISMMFSSIG